MTISNNHRRRARHLRHRWQAELTKRRKVSRHHQSLLRPRSLLPLARMALWLFALLPFPAGWTALATLSAGLALFRATQISASGESESGLVHFGANDASVCHFQRREWIGKAIWSGIDSLAIFSIWVHTSQLTITEAAWGAPLFWLGSCAAPWLIVTFLPPAVIPVAFVVFLLGLPVGGGLLGDNLGPQSLEILFLTLSALTPAGWALIQIREISQGHFVLILLTPLILAATAIALSTSRSWSRKIREEILAPRNPEAVTEDLMEGGSRTFGEEFARFREHKAIEFPGVDTKPRDLFPILAWLAGIVVAASLIVRFAGFIPAEPRSIFFGVSLLVCNATLLPLFRNSAWFEAVALSPTQITASHLLSVLPLRVLFRQQIARDLKESFRVILPLAAINATAFLIVFPPLPALFASGLVTLFFISKLPLRWANLAAWPLSFGISPLRALLRILAILPMLVLIVAEISFLFICLLGQFSDTLSTQLTVLTAALNLISASLAMLCWQLSVRAEERQWADLVKRGAGFSNQD